MIEILICRLTIYVAQKTKINNWLQKTNLTSFGQIIQSLSAVFLSYQNRDRSLNSLNYQLCAINI